MSRVMRKKGKFGKILAVLLSVAMIFACMEGVVTVVPGGTDVAHAAEEDFVIDDGVLIAYMGSDEDITIPDSVTEIAAEAFLEDMTIVSVTIPSSVTKIGDMAFYKAYFLESVVFEGALPEMGDDPFYNYYTIEFTVQTPADADELRDALWNLTEDYEYTITVVNEGGEPTPPPTPTTTIADDWSYEAVTIDGTAGYKVTGYTGGHSGAMNKQNQKSVTIPEEYNGLPVIAIGYSQDIFGSIRYSSVFSVPAGLSSITIPASVEVIEAEAFAGCENLTSIDLSNVKKLGEGAFRNCHGLTGAITIPATLDLAWDGTDGAGNVDEFSFTMCSGITAFNVAENHPELISKDGVLFNKDGSVLIAYPLGSDRTTYDIPEGTKTVHDNAFKQNQMNQTCVLENVSLPGTLTTVGSAAFQGLTIEELTINPGIEFDDYAFALNQNLKKVTFAEGVTTIPESLLHGCENLEEVNLPSTLETIEKGAFVRCKKLTAIELPEGLKKIGENAFEGSNLKSVTIPGSVTEIGELAFYLSKDLATVTFAEGTETLDLGKYTFNSCHSLESIKLPNRVKTLEDGVFSMCVALTEIDMPEVTTMNNYVFSNTGFTEFDFSKSAPKVTKMGSGTFRGVPLTSAVLPEKLTALGTCTFEECEYLTKVVIPDTVTIDKVPTDTFWYCENLHEINLPASIKATDPCAFSGCGTNGDAGLTINTAHEEKNFKRSLFDCMPVKVGEDWDRYGTWNEDYTVFTFFEGADAAFVEQDHTDGQTNAEYDNVDNKSYDNKANQNGTGATAFNMQIKSKNASAVEAVCGCTVSTGGTYTATAATFNYKTPSSNETAGSGTSTGNSGSTSGTVDSTASDKTVATGDEADLSIYMLLLVLSSALILLYRRRMVR